MGLGCQDCDAQLKKERGCFEKGIIPYYIGNEKYFRCPIKLVSKTNWEYIKAYGFYKNRFLPNGTAWLNESEKFLDAMSTIASEIAKMEKEKSKPKKQGRHRGRR